MTHFSRFLSFFFSFDMSHPLRFLNPLDFLLQDEIEKVRKRQADRETEKVRRDEELVSVGSSNTLHQPFLDHPAVSSCN